MCLPQSLFITYELSACKVWIIISLEYSLFVFIANVTIKMPVHMMSWL